MLFGSDFFWGTATAAHQVEGNNKNNWTEWEQFNPQILLEKYPKENYISGNAVDHFTRYKEDIQIMKSLNLNSYRFSIEWSRIEPQEGNFDKDAINHYKKFIEELKKNNIEPFVTMFHFTLPVWFKGWHLKSSIEYFYRYARLLLESFPEVKYWITINEPIIYSLVSYLLGEWPPMRKNPILFYRVIKNLSIAHSKVYGLADPGKCIGFSKNLLYFRKIPWGLGIVKYIWNKWWFSLIKNNYDFIGVNYYLPLDMTWSSLFNANTDYFKDVKKNNKVSDLGWEICPQGLYKVLLDLKKYNKPIFITENGIADHDDSRRASFIQRHINEIKKAKSGGIDIIGYFHWSLMDNFEWNKGFYPRFGLVEIDYENNLERKVRESAYYYRDLITHGI